METKVNSIGSTLKAVFWITGANKYRSGHWVFLLLGLLLGLLFAAERAPAQQEGTWYRDQDLRISFYYSDRFVPEDPAELSTRYVVNWRARQSRGLIATCYLKAIPTEVDELTGREYLKSNSQDFTASWVRNTERRASAVDLVASRPVLIDGLQALYVVMDTRIENFDEIYDLRTFSLITFWKGHEIVLECGTSIRSVVLGNLPDDQAKVAISNVEDEIQRILRTLHFQRH
mmetsp:Transcript_8356/g.14177  ORF Transcript_8356/g.14177 Transcript_8356/m.14177 type:complete len:231 (-) Transcript_8356:65-757(-)|eukprot:CAMPEP_0184437438 /NCGR_PEP_ID=MMETSP0738-20130409/596382_1 /TAXON_ID=385413 /ORGANISM="Thalassiosira miniscula, Strain CCMP1093" /LENGTH=230 /DNA_ID=CAMNT_0026804459 /DNA_START=180 /DNA_END=872 /DNA_ORIENTATION=-